MNGPTGALVLAGGAGRRARPADKLLTAGPDGRTVLGRVLDALAASRIAPVLVVVGDRAERIAAACPGADLVFAHDHQEGIAASLRCGILAATDRGWGAALVCLGDMPLVRPATLALIAEAAHPDGRRPDAVVPLANRRRGNPVRWDRRMFGALLTLRGDRGAAMLLTRPGCDVLAVETGDPGALEDLDDAAALARFAAGPAHSAARGGD